MRQDEEGNGRAAPCYIQRDCPLLQEQATGNEISRDMLAELKLMRKSLVGPATGANRVPTRVLFWVIVAFASIVIVQKVVDSGYEASASSAGSAVAVKRAEKKTE